ncbi:MAG: hypothetical protein AVDCRST_MAG56-6239, partial [uncultured Cytophagales bacterium]
DHFLAKQGKGDRRPQEGRPEEDREGGFGANSELRLSSWGRVRNPALL